MSEQQGEPAYKVGDRVRKHSGDYTLEGEVRAVVVKLSGQVRYVVEAYHPRGLLHIYSAANLEPLEERHEIGRGG